MIPKWINDILKLYSFVEKIESKNHYLFLYYKKDDNVVYKKLSLRANRNQLITFIEKIKKEIGYEKIKKNRDEKVKSSMGTKVPLINTER